MAHEPTDDLNTSMILVFGLLAAVLTFVAILLLTAMFNSFKYRQELAEVPVPYAEPDRVLAQQQQQLNDYAWIDPAAGQVRVPVDLAMTQVVASLKSDPESAGVRDSKFAEAPPAPEPAADTGVESPETAEQAAEPAAKE